MAFRADTRNTGLFVVGIVMAVRAAALMVWSSISVAPLIVIGVVIIGAGARRRR